MADNNGIGLNYNSGTNYFGTTKQTSMNENGGGGNSILNTLFDNLGEILQGGSTLVTAFKTDPNAQAAANNNFMQQLLQYQASMGARSGTSIPAWLIVLLVMIVLVVVAVFAFRKK